MKFLHAVTILKALADESRLKLFLALMDRPSFVEELAERMGLAASTVSFHLKKLEEARLISGKKEQYYILYRVNQSILEIRLKELLVPEDEDVKEQVQNSDKFKNKVLDIFMPLGRITQIPVQWKKRRILLEEILKKFEKGRRYSEKEINHMLAEFHEDYCLLRRELVEERLMSRESGIYWVSESSESQNESDETESQTEQL